MNLSFPTRNRWRLAPAAGAVLIAISSALLMGTTSEGAERDPLIERGFRAMYGLDFAACERDFTDYQARQPTDPLGHAGLAACLLFTELYRLGALDAELYLDNKDLFVAPRIAPDPALRARLFALTTHAREIAEARLSKDAADQEALFASALARGLEADYIFMIDKKSLRAATPGRAATESAKQLLRVNDRFYDAYIWTGVTSYVVASLPFPLRWLARLRGYSGDKETARRDLMATAEHGALLKPYASILLTVIALREKDIPSARARLEKLAAEFPTNTLFRKHAERLAARR